MLDGPVELCQAIWDLWALGQEVFPGRLGRRHRTVKAWMAERRSLASAMGSPPARQNAVSGRSELPASSDTSSRTCEVEPGTDGEGWTNDA